ncbi:MAG: hypothetical protein AAGG11_01560 [Pseudomonadota bacterium]
MRHSAEAERVSAALPRGSGMPQWLSSLALLGTIAAALLTSATTALAGAGRQNSTAGSATAIAVPPLPAAAAIESLSDADLTALSVHWSQLSAEQRRALLKTVRARMQRENRASGAASPLQSQRRFGRVVRQRDGRVVSIETRVYRRADGSGGSVSHRMTFGAGFEQRQRSARRATVVAAPDGPAPDSSPAAAAGSPEQPALPGVTRASAPAVHGSAGTSRELPRTATAPRQ